MNPANNRQRRTLWIACAAVALALVSFAMGRISAPNPSASPASETTSVEASRRDGTPPTDSTGARAVTTTAAAPTGETATTGERGCAPVAASDQVALSELPAQAARTIRNINDGPPFPFRADGGVFQNREGLLPDRARGYYREYTVVTPGASDRGARRIVSGSCGELYYTADHYRSFAMIDQDR